MKEREVDRFLTSWFRIDRKNLRIHFVDDQMFLFSSLVAIIDRKERR
jgi:hypothetical protein